MSLPTATAVFWPGVHPTVPLNSHLADSNETKFSLATLSSGRLCTRAVWRTWLGVQMDVFLEWKCIEKVDLPGKFLVPCWCHGSFIHQTPRRNSGHWFSWPGGGSIISMNLDSAVGVKCNLSHLDNQHHPNNKPAGFHRGCHFPKSPLPQVTTSLVPKVTQKSSVTRKITSQLPLTMYSSSPVFGPP